MPTPETSIVGRDEVVFRYRDQHVTNPVGRSSIVHLEKTVIFGIPERIEYRRVNEVRHTSELCLVTERKGNEQYSQLNPQCQMDNSGQVSTSSAFGDVIKLVTLDDLSRNYHGDAKELAAHFAGRNLVALPLIGQYRSGGSEFTSHGDGKLLVFSNRYGVQGVQLFPGGYPEHKSLIAKK